MPRPLYDSEYIFGLHEPGGERLMLEAGRPGWIVFTEAIGSDPNDMSGKDFSPWSSRNLGILCRLNNGYYPGGTIPNQSEYPAFAQRCANYAAASRGCRLWVIGNEMNHWQERPPAVDASAFSAPSFDASFSVEEFAAAAMKVAAILGYGSQQDANASATGTTSTPPPAPFPAVVSRTHQVLEAAPSFTGLGTIATLPPGALSFAPAPANAQAMSQGPGAAITPEMYAQCYRLCRDAIHAVAGHSADQVLIGAVAPWNAQTRYPGNEAGDWVKYLEDILHILGPDGCDGITLHTYTHGPDPALIVSDQKMNPPFQHRHYEFRAYVDFMGAIPQNMRNLPVYITETNQNDPWLDQNIGWVQAAYGEIDWWNRQAGAQQIRSLVLYRWPQIDQWYIEGKMGVIADFQAALPHNYKWKEQQEPFPFSAGDTVKTTVVVNMRRTPGNMNKPPDDIVAQLALGTSLTVLSGQHQRKDGLIWWNLRINSGGQMLDGWVAQATAGGLPLLEKQTAIPPTPPPPGTFAPGDRVQTLDAVRMRQTPGYVGKPPADIIADLPRGARLVIQRGPTKGNGLDYWHTSGKDADGRDIVGWVAERAANGATLLAKVLDPFVSFSPQPTFTVGERAQTKAPVRFRRTPGYTNKPANDVMADLSAQTTGAVVGGPQAADGLTWWNLDMPIPDGSVQRGWAAELDPNGITLLGKVKGALPTPPSPGFARGDLLTARDAIRVRRSPGVIGKPDDDVLGAFAPKTTLSVNAGPQEVDGLTWWHVGGINSNAVEMMGWVAQKLGDGTELIGLASQLPNTNFPDKAAGAFLHSPIQTPYRISQLWGENPQIYGAITYDGVPLRGHNGIDFGTPIGTPLTAVDVGVVAAAIYDDPTGFGNYVKLQHSWGESLYAHMDGIQVQSGQQVSRGQVIGTSGNTGFGSGPHLHFAIRINPYDRRDGWGGFTDPLPYMNPNEMLLPTYVLPPAAVGVVAAPELSFSMPSQGVAPGAPTYAPLETAPGLLPERPGVRRP